MPIPPRSFEYEYEGRCAEYEYEDKGEGEQGSNSHSCLRKKGASTGNAPQGAAGDSASHMWRRERGRPARFRQRLRLGGLKTNVLIVW